MSEEKRYYSASVRLFLSLSDVSIRNGPHASSYKMRVKLSLCLSIAK